MRDMRPFGILLLFTCAMFDVLFLIIAQRVIFPLLRDAPYLPKEYAQAYTHLDTLQVHSHRKGWEAINAIAFSPDGATLATAGYKEIRLWDVRTGDLLSTLKEHSSWINAVTFSPDGKTLVSVSMDRRRFNTHTTMLWDPSEQRQKQAHTQLASYTIWLWDTKTGTSRLTFNVIISPLTALEFSPDSTKLLIASQNGIIEVYDSTTGRSELSNLGLFVHDRMLNRIGAIAFAATLHDKIIACWVWKTDDFMPSLIPKAEIERRFSAVQWFTHFRFVEDPSIGLNTGSARPLSFLTPDTYPVGALTFTPNGKTLASGGRDREFRLYDVADAKIHLWDANTGHLFHTFKSPGGHVRLLTFSPDGKTLASVGQRWRNRVFIWDIENYRLLSIINTGKRTIKALQFAPNSITLASAHSDGAVHLWDITGQQK